MQSKWKRKIVNRATIKSEKDKQNTFLLEKVELARVTAAIEYKNEKR